MCSIHISEQPQHDARVVAAARVDTAEREGVVLLRIVETSRPLELRARRGQVAEREEHVAARDLRLQGQRGVAETLGEAPALVRQLFRRAQPDAQSVEDTEALQDLEELR